MKRILAWLLAVLVAVAVFGMLVHAVLVAAHLSTPAATAVTGATPRRLWATGAIVLALAGAGLATLALRRATRRIGPGHGRREGIVAAVLGWSATVGGGANLAVANGGPGTGNGVVGAAMAVVLGLSAVIVAGLALVRSRRDT